MNIDRVREIMAPRLDEMCWKNVSQNADTKRWSHCVRPQGHEEDECEDANGNKVPNA